MNTDENELKIGAVFSLASPEKDETDVTFESAGPKEAVAMVTYNDDSNESNGKTPTTGDDMTSPVDEMTSYVSDMTSSKMSAIADEALHDSHPHTSESLLSAEPNTFTTETNDESMPSLSPMKQQPLSSPTRSFKATVAAASEDESPPRLPKEYFVDKLVGEDFMGNQDSIAPPVLRPEVPSLTKIKASTLLLWNLGRYRIPSRCFPEKATALEKDDFVPTPLPAKKRKIDPSYIVLTSIDPWLGTRSSVTLSDFAHAQTECSNMCKKISFKRRLTRGDDVFNVKTPSKQKDYHVYLEKFEKNQEVNASKKPGVGITMKDLLTLIKDNKLPRRSKRPAKSYLNRVRRTIVHVPADFKTSVATAELEQLEIPKDNKKALENKEKELWAERREREKVCELETLGKFIEIKRRWNKKLKRLKSALKRPATVTEGTRSLSGRVRKSNSRYSVGFVSDKMELLAEEINARMLAKIKYASEMSRYKLRIEENRHCKALERSVLEMTQLHKKQKVDIVIERVDEVDVPKEGKIKTQTVRNNKKRVYGKTGTALNRTGLMLDIENEICTQREALRNGKGLSNSKAQNSAERKPTDGVLIQNAPNENCYIRSLLTTKSFSPDLSRVKSEPMDSHDLDKQPMTLSDLMTSQVRVFKTELIDNGYEQANDALIEEKFKKFKVPDKVKQLFINKSQSQIPTGYPASPSCASGHDVNVFETSKWTPPATSSQYLVIDSPVLLPGVSTSSANTVVYPQPLTSGGYTTLRFETNQLSTSKQRLTLTKVTTAKSNQTVTSLTTAASKPPVSTAASHVITNTLRSSQQNHPPSPPVSAILPKPNTRPQVLFIPVTTTGQIASGGVFPVPVRTRFPVASQSLVPSSVNGQLLESCVIHQASPTSKLENPSMPQKVTVMYSAHDPSKPPVQTVGSMRPITLSTTSTAPKRVSSLLPTTLNDADDKTPTNSNAKFYLLKVDGKNILIPLATDHSPPVAYVMNGTSLLKTTAPTAMTSTILSTARNVSTVSVAPRTAYSVGGNKASAVETTCTQIAPTVKTTSSSTAASATIFSATSLTVPCVGANNTLVLQSTATSRVVNSQGTSKTTLTQKAQTLKTIMSAGGNTASALQTTRTQVAPTKNTTNSASSTQTDASARVSQIYNRFIQTVGQVTSTSSKSTQPLAKVNAFLRPSQINQSGIVLQLQTLKTSKNEGNKSESSNDDLAISDGRNSPSDVKETQLQTLKTKLVNMKSKYDGSEKTAIRDFLKDFRGETSAKETICNSSLTNTSSAEHSAKNTTHPSEPTKHNLVTSDFTTLSEDVKETTTKPFSRRNNGERRTIKKT
ncbi:uncharacterized protein LOC127861005 [Dreissena polymorpha]|uniref:Uncharacterized protein n=1 Tax=Dreissena polymorpha TaxID=45954 RepID=A0A9D3YKU5_DREPO|nr:uncharacterized protein LOC127861005 [Dreissena polymorpha]KAH3700644.1 hypothetical protein DPMN_075621 [Dreissena polymorpha]